MANGMQHVRLVGRLVLAKSNKDDKKYWGKLLIPQPFVRGLFAALNEPGIEPSPGQAHISVFTADEIEKIGADKISESGKYFPFKLESVKHVRPSGWSEMSRVYFVVVKSPELKKLRASYGLTPLLHGTHEFHITIAVRKRGVLAPNNSITKHAKFEFIPRNYLIPAAAGLAGAGLGSLADKKRKGNWLQRHVGALLGGIGGVGAGIAGQQFIPRSDSAATNAAPARPQMKVSPSVPNGNINADIPDSMKLKPESVTPAPQDPSYMEAFRSSMPGRWMQQVRDVTGDQSLAFMPKPGMSGDDLRKVLPASMGTGAAFTLPTALGATRDAIRSAPALTGWQRYVGPVNPALSTLGASALTMAPATAAYVGTENLMTGLDPYQGGSDVMRTGAPLAVSLKTYNALHPKIKGMMDAMLKVRAATAAEPAVAGAVSQAAGKIPLRSQVWQGLKKLGLTRALLMGDIANEASKDIAGNIYGNDMHTAAKRYMEGMIRSKRLGGSRLGYALTHPGQVWSFGNETLANLITGVKDPVSVFSYDPATGLTPAEFKAFNGLFSAAPARQKQEMFHEYQKLMPEHKSYDPQVLKDLLRDAYGVPEQPADTQPPAWLSGGKSHEDLMTGKIPGRPRAGGLD